MLTLETLITQIKAKCENHAQINTFYYGNPWDFGADLLDSSGNESILYPFVGMDVPEVSLNGNIQSIKCKMFFSDLAHKDQRNITHVTSDMLSIAHDIMSKIYRDLSDNYDATISPDYTLVKFEDRFDDEVTGWEVDFTIQQFYDRSTCQIPVRTGTVAPNTQVVSIIDRSTGDTIITLYMGQSYSVEQLREVIDTITGNEVTITTPLT